MSTREIPLKNIAKVALVDEKDFPLINRFSWYIAKDHNIEYAKAYFGIKNKNIISDRLYKIHNRKSITMHVLIMNPPKGKVVDHKDRNGLNNTRENLRLCTTAQNLHNRKISIKNTSGYRGVSYNTTEKRKKRWVAAIKIEGKYVYIGRFYTKEEAAIAYNRIAFKHFGEFARLNIVDKQPKIEENNK